jgi:peptidoglycan/xylan/chitin deacetylase (PgdA/CDA1 family)
VVLSFDDGTQDAYTNAWPIMRRHGFVGSFYVITSRIYRKNRPSSYSMSQIQVQDLAASGNEIGNHTRDHTCLSGTAFDVEAYEIGRGARDIRGVAGAQPATLAWPKGCYDSSAVRAAREAGTFLAFTTYPGCHETFANRLTAPRIRVHRTTTAAGLLRMLAPCRPAPHGLDTSTSSSQLRGPEAR